MKRQFYVYVYRDPDTLVPFYVGKGQGRRSHKHLHQTANRSMRTRLNKFKEVGKMPVIETIPTDSEDGAYELEASLIASIGRIYPEGGTLVNLLPAGERTTGFTGHHHTEEAKEAMRQKLKGTKRSPETIAKMRAAAKKRNWRFTEEHFDRLREVLKTPEHRAKMSEHAKRTVTSERLADMTEKARLATKGKKQTPEQVRKRVESARLTRERKKNAAT